MHQGSSCRKSLYRDNNSHLLPVPLCTRPEFLTTFLTWDLPLFPSFFTNQRVLFEIQFIIHPKHQFEHSMVSCEKRTKKALTHLCTCIIFNIHHAQNRPQNIHFMLFFSNIYQFHFSVLELGEEVLFNNKLIKLFANVT